MKALNLIIPVLLALSACTGSTTTESESDADTTSTLQSISIDSITYNQQRQSLTNKLEALVTSYDETINQLKQGSDNTSQDLINKLEKAKDRVERDLQEVNTTSLNGWDINYVERIEMSIEKNQMELADIKASASK